MTSFEETNDDELFLRRLQRSQEKKLDPRLLLAEDSLFLKTTKTNCLYSKAGIFQGSCRKF